MRQAITGKKSQFYTILILTLSILLLRDIINRGIIVLLGLFCWVLIYIYGRKQHNHLFSLLRILILSIPLSFTNIFGSSYAMSNISWFNIFLLMIVLTYLLEYLFLNKVYFNSISLLSIVLLMISIIPVLIAKDKVEGIKHYINSTVLFILLIIGNSFKRDLTNLQKDELIKDYIYGTLIACIGTIIQIVFFKSLNITIGKYELLGGYRHAFGFLFEDYSFLSLYLTSGAMILYFSAKIKSNLSKNNLLLIALLLITSILTSARTGIVSFMVIFAIYSVFKLLDLIRQGSLKSVLIITMNLLLVIVAYKLVGSTRNVARFSDSGRRQLNIKAFEIFLENPIFGIGFGSGNYIGMLPHNIFFQSLAQGGLLFTIPLLLLFGLIVIKSYKRGKELFPTILVVLVGAMFIPNIFNSRFFSVVLLLLSLHL